MQRTRQFHLGTAAAIAFRRDAGDASLTRCPGAAARCGRDRQRRHRRRRHQRERPRGRRVGDRGNHAICRPASPRSSSPTIRAATSCPTCRKRNYNVWVRGYGLVDSPKVESAPGKHLNLKAVPAPNAAAAAQYYPAIYWYSMLKIPDASEFGGKAILRAASVTQQRLWLDLDEEQRLRRLPPARPARDAHDPGGVRQVQDRREAWMRRIQSGQAGEHGDQLARGPARRRAVQVFRRLDRPHRQGRTAACQAARGRRASSATS